MTTNRILFPGNPWPEGHPIKEFSWTARSEGGRIWFDLHLKTDDYDSERQMDEPDDEDIDYPSAWEDPATWCNYHACILSSTKWSAAGFPAGSSEDFSWDLLDGREWMVDSPPPEDLEDNAFNIYLLGHDAVAEHRIRFVRRAEPGRFDIVWSGRIALAYVGDYEYKHDFIAYVFDVEAPSIVAAKA